MHARFLPAGELAGIGGAPVWAPRWQRASLTHYRFIPSASAYTAILLGAPRGDPTPIRGSVSTVPSRFFARFAPSFGLHDL